MRRPRRACGATAVSARAAAPPRGRSASGRPRRRASRAPRRRCSRLQERDLAREPGRDVRDAREEIRRRAGIGQLIATRHRSPCRRRRATPRRPARRCRRCRRWLPFPAEMHRHRSGVVGRRELARAEAVVLNVEIDPVELRRGGPDCPVRPQPATIVGAQGVCPARVARPGDRHRQGRRGWESWSRAMSPRRVISFQPGYSTTLLTPST